MISLVLLFFDTESTYGVIDHPTLFACDQFNCIHIEIKEYAAKTRDAEMSLDLYMPRRVLTKDDAKRIEEIRNIIYPSE